LAQAVRGIAAVRRRWASSRAGVLLSIVADLESRSEVGLLAWAATADAVAELVREAAASLGLR